MTGTERGDVEADEQPHHGLLPSGLRCRRRSSRGDGCRGGGAANHVLRAAVVAAAVAAATISTAEYQETQRQRLQASKQQGPRSNGSKNKTSKTAVATAKKSTQTDFTRAYDSARRVSHAVNHDEERAQGRADPDVRATNLHHIDHVSILKFQLLPGFNVETSVPGFNVETSADSYANVVFSQTQDYLVRHSFNLPPACHRNRADIVRAGRVSQKRMFVLIARQTISN